MEDHLEILAIIPARGGSKSIPGKNIKLLGQHPLIAYSIAAGLKSNSITRTIVSTDDEATANISKRYGAEVPFMRPDELAEDHVTDLPVFEHALNFLKREENYQPDIIVQLRPTSPFRPEGSIDASIQMMRERPDADAVRAVTPSGQNPFKMWLIENDQLQTLVPSIFKEAYNMPRQELPATYWQTGHLEVIRRSTIEDMKSLTGEIILPYIIDTKYAIDLDNLEQWAYAEYIMKQQRFIFVTPEETID